VKIIYKWKDLEKELCGHGKFVLKSTKYDLFSVADERTLANEIQ
jgi:hypothetical protein